MVEPIYHEWPNADEAYDQPNQFLFGSELVVAPLTTPADPRTRLASVRAWLPAGTWVDVFTGVVYDGGRELLLHRDLTSIPVLAAAGAIVPLDGAEVPGNDPVNPSSLEVLVVVGADGSFTLVEDDGADGIARTTLTYSQGTLTVAPPTGSVDCLPATRTWTVTFLAFDGTPVVPGFASRTERHDGRVSVTVDDVPVHATLTVELGPDPQLTANDVAGRLFTLLDRAQISYDLKTRIHQIATSDAPLSVRASHLQSLALDPPLATAVGELLLART